MEEKHDTKAEKIVFQNYMTAVAVRVYMAVTKNKVGVEN